jgi:hypothetical protein
MSYVIALLALVVCCQSFAAEAPAAPKPGDAVPELTAKDDTGAEVKLSSHKDKNGLVLFFFPKANTGG